MNLSGLNFYLISILGKSFNIIPKDIDAKIEPINALDIIAAWSIFQNANNVINIEKNNKIPQKIKNSSFC